MATRDYRVHMPRDVFVKTVCEEVNCENWRYGWDSQLDESDKLGQAQAEYIRHSSQRTFIEMKGPNGTTVFRFESGQRCFTEHRTRPARLSVAVGGRTLVTHASLADLAEDYTQHCGTLAAQFERG